MAVDGGGQFALENAEISISVVGPDDSPPVFDQSWYSFSVDENAPRFRFVGSVSAHNVDSSKF